MYSLYRERIKELIERMQVTQAHMAVMLNVTPQTLRKWIAADSAASLCKPGPTARRLIDVLYVTAIRYGAQNADEVCNRAAAIEVFDPD